MNLTLKLSQLNGLIGDLFQYAGKFVQNLFNSIMGLLLIAVYQILVAPFLLLADGIQLFFIKLAGLDTYYVNGQEQSGDIVLSLINNKTVQDVFWALLILGVVLLIITTIVALVRSETQAVDSKDRKSKNKIFSESVRALFNFFMVPVVAILGIFMGNALLRALDGATIDPKKSSETRISTYIFRASAYEANRARNDIAFADDLRLNHFNDMGVIQGTDQESIAQAIDEAFINFTSIDNKKFKYPSQNLFADDGTYLHLLTFSTYHVTRANSVKSYFSIYDAPMVFYYYDLASFNFILCWIGIFFVIWVLFSTALGLVKRIFKLTILLVVSPPIVAISPLDNGSALGKWKKQFIGGTLSAYSTVVSLNLVFLLLGPVTNIDLFKVGRIGIAASLLNNISTLIITIGALLFFKDFTKSLADMIGGEDAYADGSKAVADGAKKVTKGVMGTVGLAGGLANLSKAKLAERSGDSETAKKYQDLAKARFKQMGSNYGSLATNGVSDAVLKEIGDNDKLTGVSKAKGALAKKDDSGKSARDRLRDMRIAEKNGINYGASGTKFRNQFKDGNTNVEKQSGPDSTSYINNKNGGLINVNHFKSGENGNVNKEGGPDSSSGGNNKNGGGWNVNNSKSDEKISRFDNRYKKDSQVWFSWDLNSPSTSDINSKNNKISNGNELNSNMNGNVGKGGFKAQEFDSTNINENKPKVKKRKKNSMGKITQKRMKNSKPTAPNKKS